MLSSWAIILYFLVISEEETRCSIFFELLMLRDKNKSFEKDSHPWV